MGRIREAGRTTLSNCGQAMTLPSFIPVSQPSIGEREIAYVTDAVRSGWVSSLGHYIEDFERGSGFHS